MRSGGAAEYQKRCAPRAVARRASQGPEYSRRRPRPDPTVAWSRVAGGPVQMGDATSATTGSGSSSTTSDGSTSVVGGVADYFLQAGWGSVIVAFIVGGGLGFMLGFSAGETEIGKAVGRGVGRAAEGGAHAATRALMGGILG